MAKALWFWLWIALIFSSGCVWAQENRYVGLEFFGSTRIDRAKLEQLVNLKNDASPQRVTAAAARLQKYFEHERLSANIEVVSAGADGLALSVDVPEPLSSILTRRLNAPHHVRLASDKPFLLLASLHGRLDQLSQEGRAAQEDWRDGYKFYSDEPANQMIEEIQKFLPSMRKQLLEIVDCDPDPVRRAQSIELLEGAPEPDDTAVNLLAAIDDVDLRVRAESVKYFYARLDMLSDDFPFDGLVQGLSRMLDRPSHKDRSKSLYCLLKLCQLHKDVLPLAKSLCEPKVTELSQKSILPSIKQTSDKLLTLFAHVPRFATPEHKEQQDSRL